MSDLRIQRALLCFLVVIGLVLTYWGISVTDWWLAAMVGPVLIGWAACAVLRVNREIRVQKAYLPSLMKDVAFAHELRLSGGRIEAAQEALAEKKRQGVYR
jgi:hypothetical protein